ncbi:MAG: cyclic nucleotide-binding domain-containing protein [Acidobacteria bacterium]|nr:cyclic nucleotide-binding domain-containing protein [Acidobacteriota bacterium]
MSRTSWVPAVNDISLTIDDKKVVVPAGTTIFDAARMRGIPIPTLCHQQNETPVGVCRLCVVDVGARVYTAACIREAENNMVVKTNSEGVQAARKTLVELLMADHPSPCARQQHSGDCELESLAKRYEIATPRFARRLTPAHEKDESSLSIMVDHSACILCDRCVRGCSEIRHNFVIARQGKGYAAAISFDTDEPMGSSSCVSCGECMVSCPTGALTNKKVVGQHLELEGKSVSPQELLELEVFKGVSGTFLELNKGAVVRREFKKGEVICREGDYGSTAFFILGGSVDIFISTPRAHVDTEGSDKGFLSKLASKLKPRKEHQREEENTVRKYIQIDAPVDLEYDHPVAKLQAGDLFGEMTCMSFYPRSATVVAAEYTVCLEMLRNVLDVLQKNKTFRSKLDANYRARALETHLKSVPIFSSLTQDFIDYLRDRVELRRFTPGQVICRQGDPAGSFYLVRIGFVKVSEHHPGGELVLSYLARGSYFGEIGLLSDEGIRTATCTALDHVEVVRISREDFLAMVGRFPQVRASLEAVAKERIEENRSRLHNLQNVPVDDFLRQGLMDAQSLLVLDLDRCTRCDQCVKACADAHDGITRLIRDGLRFDHYLVATSCRQCRDPLCMVGCPVGSIRRRNSLEVIIEDWCVGCGLCANNCPYGNINLHEFELPSGGTGQKAKVKKATSCNLCYDHPEPSCVYACPHDAAHRVNPPEFFGEMLGGKEVKAVPYSMSPGMMDRR